MTYSLSNKATLDTMLRLIDRLSFLAAVQTPSSELRVNVNSGTLPTVTTVGTVTTTSTLTNQTQEGGYILAEKVRAQMNTAHAVAIRARITVS